MTREAVDSARVKSADLSLELLQLLQRVANLSNHLETCELHCYLDANASRAL